MNKCSRCGQTIPEVIKKKKKVVKREKVKTQRQNKLHFNLAIKYKTTSGKRFKQSRVVRAITKSSAIELLSNIISERIIIAKNSNSMLQEYANWVEFKVEMNK